MSTLFVTLQSILLSPGVDRRCQPVGHQLHAAMAGFFFPSRMHLQPCLKLLSAWEPFNHYNFYPFNHMGIANSSYPLVQFAIQDHFWVNFRRRPILPKDQRAAVVFCLPHGSPWSSCGGRRPHHARWWRSARQQNPTDTLPENFNANQKDM